ncbi:branched-chain amino acid ABC transporter permease [Hyphomicrobium methylovorum]|nr:branched-chain amino acid ABC transporter permease [Hyphomicrobium methylovorum]
MTSASSSSSRATNSLITPGVLFILAAAYTIPPLIGSEYLFNAILAPTLALGLAALGLNLLTGYAGQVSLASAAFMAIGAFAAYNLTLRVPDITMVVSFILAGLFAAAIGLIFCLPAFRLRGFYLAISTLAAQFFVQWATNFPWVTNYSPSGVIDAPPISIFGYVVQTIQGKYFVALTIVALLTIFVARLVRTQAGLNFIAIRDNELAAKVIGVPVLKTKLLVFAISSFIIGISGVLWAFTYLGTIQAGYGGFDLNRSFSVLFCIIIGGLATIRGSYLGAAFMVAFPLLLSRVGGYLFADLNAGILENCQKIIIGALIILVLIFEPDGLSALIDRMWRKITGANKNDKEKTSDLQTIGNT